MRFDSSYRKHASARIDRMQPSDRDGVNRGVRQEPTPSASLTWRPLVLRVLAGALVATVSPGNPRCSRLFLRCQSVLYASRAPRDSRQPAVSYRQGRRACRPRRYTARQDGPSPIHVRTLYCFAFTRGCTDAPFDRPSRGLRGGAIPCRGSAPTPGDRDARRPQADRRGAEALPAAARVLVAGPSRTLRALPQASGTFCFFRGRGRALSRDYWLPALPPHCQSMGTPPYVLTDSGRG